MSETGHKKRNSIVMVAGSLLLAGAFLLLGVAARAGVKVTEDAPVPSTPKTPLPLVIYADGVTSAPYAATGWMGNINAIGFNDQCAESPHSGATCMKLEYKAAGDWAGIVWQDPPNDWGDQNGGHDLTGASKLTFWARGVTGGEKVEFYFGVIKSEKAFPDSGTGRIAVTLTRDWRQYNIDLSGKNLSHIKTGFGWSLPGQGKPITFYLDDVQYE